MSAEQKKTKVIEYIGQIRDGGAETLVVNYAQLIDRERFDVVIMTTFPPSPCANYDRVKENRIRVVSVFKKASILNKLLFHLFSDRMVGYLLKKRIREEKPNVIHIHLCFLHYFSPIGSSLKGINLFYTCHNLPQLMFGNQHPGEKEAAKKLIRDNQLTLIALHEDMREELNRMFEVHNTPVVNNGIDVSKFQNLPESQEEIRKALGIPSGSFVMGHIGRLQEQKNHRFLISLFAEVLKKEPAARLLFVGDGPLEKEILSQVHELGLDDYVTWLSHRTDIPRLLKAMDVFVFPSLFEGLSVTMVEAQAAGLRCVVSDTVNSATAVTDQIVFLPLSAPLETWSEQILNRNPVKNTHKNQLADFDMKNVVKYLESLYKESQC